MATAFDIAGSEEPPDSRIVRSHRLLSGRPIFLTASATCTVSDAERAFARVDGYISASPYRQATQAMLANIEAISTAIIENSCFELYDLLEADASGKALHQLDSIAMRQALYRKSIESCNSWKAMRSFHFDAKSLAELDAGTSVLPVRQGLRGRLEHGSDDPGSIAEMDAGDVPKYLDDLCAFCNQPAYSPIIQSSAAALRIREIRPFGHDAAELSRKVGYVVYAQRHFASNMIVPLAMISLYRRDRLDRLPAHPAPKDIAVGYFEQRPFEKQIVESAIGILECAGIVLRIEQSLGNIGSSWRRSVEGVRKGNACDILLSDLLVHPVIDVAYACKVTGKSFSTVNDSIHKLEAYRVIDPMSSRKRNRKFFATSVVSLYQDFIDELLPLGWTPGTSVFGDRR